MHILLKSFDRKHITQEEAKIDATAKRYLYTFTNPFTRKILHSHYEIDNISRIPPF
jgi:hypothetical protein